MSADQLRLDHDGVWAHLDDTVELTFHAISRGSKIYFPFEDDLTFFETIARWCQDASIRIIRSTSCAIFVNREDASLIILAFK